MIISWICQECRWMNDNNHGTCRRCGAETKFVKGKEIVTVHADLAKIKDFDEARNESAKD